MFSMRGIFHQITRDTIHNVTTENHLQYKIATNHITKLLGEVINFIYGIHMSSTFSRINFQTFDYYVFKSRRQTDIIFYTLPYFLNCCLSKNSYVFRTNITNM